MPRRQPFAGLRVDGLRRGRDRRRQRVLQLAAHPLDTRGVLRRAILCLGRVRLQVVQLDARGLDQLVACRAPGVQRRPAVLQLRVQRLGVGRQVLERLAEGGLAQRAALEPLRREAREVEQRRRDVDAASDRLCHDAGRHAGPGDQQRHADRRVVEKDAVGVLAVLAEALAVVGGHQHERGLACRPFLDPAQQAAELRVDEGDLAVVGRPPAGHVLGRRLVGRVWVEVVDPKKERGGLRAGRRRGVEPAQRGLGRGVGGALDVGRATGVLAAREVVVEHEEAAVEAEAALQREAGDEAGRPVAGLAQLLGHAAHPGRQDVGAVVAHPVAERCTAREDGGVGRRRERDVGHRGGETRAAGGQAVERRRDGGGVAVAPHPVGPQGVDRDEDEVRARDGRRGGLRAADGRAHGHQETGEAEPATLEGTHRAVATIREFGRDAQGFHERKQVDTQKEKD